MFWVEWAPTGLIFPHSQLFADVATADMGLQVPAGTDAHVFTIEREPALIRFLHDGAVHYQRPLSSAFTVPLQIRFKNGDVNTEKMTVAWVRIRHAAEFAPVVSVGAEELRAR
jgi:hypothetical protein